VGGSSANSKQKNKATTCKKGKNEEEGLKRERKERSRYLYCQEAAVTWRQEAESMKKKAEGRRQKQEKEETEGEQPKGREIAGSKV
jgi:hypothetical protein